MCLSNNFFSWLIISSLSLLQHLQVQRNIFQWFQSLSIQFELNLRFCPYPRLHLILVQQRDYGHFYLVHRIPYSNAMSRPSTERNPSVRMTSCNVFLGKSLRLKLIAVWINLRIRVNCINRDKDLLTPSQHDRRIGNLIVLGHLTEDRAQWWILPESFWKKCLIIPVLLGWPLHLTVNNLI